MKGVNNQNLAMIARSFGQIIFQENLISGVLFLIGICISSPIGAIFAVFSTLISAFLAWQLGVSEWGIMLGMLSFNGVLCALTFAGKKIENVLMSLGAVILSVLIMVQMQNLGLPALTFPFVLACWLVMAIRFFFIGLLSKILTNTHKYHSGSSWSEKRFVNS